MKDIKNKKIKHNEFLVKVMFLLSYIFSNSLFLIFSTSSFNSGLLFNVFFLFLFFFLYNNLLKISKIYFITLFSIFILIFIQLIISNYFFGFTAIQRSIYSLFLLFVTFLFGGFFFNFLTRINDELIDRTLKLSFFLMSSLLIFSLVLQIIGIISDKSMIIFVEPSHFLLVYFPLLTYVIFKTNKRHQVLLFIFSSGSFFLIENLIGIVSLLLIFFVISWRKRGNILLFIFFPLLYFLVIYLPQFTYYLERLNFSVSSNNLSVLVWLSGWERASNSLITTFLNGLGFQRLGFVGDTGYAMDNIYQILNGVFINLYDGGSLAPKLIAELGITGILLIVLYLIGFFKILQLKNTSFKFKNIDYFFISLYLMFFVQLFFRGVGYFSTSMLFFSSSIYWYHSKQIYII
jgi:hypothetical protein